VPIIEPVRSSTGSLQRSVAVLRAKSIPFVVVVNPAVGELEGASDGVVSIAEDLDLSSYSLFRPALIVDETTTEAQVQGFTRHWTGRQLFFVHLSNSSAGQAVRDASSVAGVDTCHAFHADRTGFRYRSQFKSFRRVLLEDAFNKATKNADYPDDEFFSDLWTSFEDQGYDGFADFAVVGSDYQEEGGPAYAVAIHLTYQHSDEEVWIRHFISDRRKTQVDPGGKFLEALAHLVDYVERPGFSPTNASREFVDLFRRKHFPGLGYVKKLSICHHIELMNTLLKNGSSGL